MSRAEDVFSRVAVVDGFLADPRPLRRAFERATDDRSDPLDPVRFQWEHWNVAGQFSQHRAPARAVLGDAMGAFEARLLAWARRNVGLGRIASPPWISFLVEGQYQGLHRDGPNGLVAFSYGLSWPKAPRFRGGETLLARPELLDYFGTGAHRAEAARDPLFDEIPSRYNRLVAFDARLPHAVARVGGVERALDGRVAIQGWLAPDGLLVTGRDDEDACRAAVDRALAEVTPSARDEGYVAVALDVARAGTVTRARPIADLGLPGARGLALACRALARARFEPRPRATEVVVPIACGPRRARVAGGAA